MNGPSAVVPDSQHRGLVAMLPPRLRDFAQLARFDRPIGWWLLFWPCAWGVLLAGGAARWDLLLWLLAGSIPGIVIGSHAAHTVPERLLRLILGMVLLTISVSLILS